MDCRKWQSNSNKHKQPLTKIEVGDVDYPRGNFIGTIADVGFKTYDPSGAVVANKAFFFFFFFFYPMSFYSFDKRRTSICKSQLLLKTNNFQ